MSKSIVITLPHALAVEDAKRRIAERIDLLRTSYIDKLAYSEVKWTDNKADLRVIALGQTVLGQIDILSDTIRIEVQLPWILAALSDKVQGVLTSNAKESLRIGYTKPKS